MAVNSERLSPSILHPPVSHFEMRQNWVTVISVCENIITVQQWMQLYSVYTVFVLPSVSVSVPEVLPV